MRGILWALLSSAVLSVTSGMSPSFAVLASPSPPGPLSAEQAQSWRSIRDARLSADGAWLVYALAPDYEAIPPAGSRHDTVEIVVRSVSGDVERRYPAGLASAGAGAVQVSGTGRWAAFHRVAADTHQVVLIDLSDGTERSFAAQTFQFNTSSFASDPAAQEWLALFSVTAPMSASSSVAGTAKTGTLIMQSLGSDTSHRFEAVQAYALDPEGESLALADTRGLQLQSLTADGGLRLLTPASGGVFSELTWSADGSALAALHAREAGTHVYAVTGVKTSSPRTVEVQPQPMEARAVGPLRWRDEHDGVYFQMRHARAVNAQSADASAPKSLSIWHWQSQRLPAEQRMVDAQPLTTWHYLNLSRQASIQLTDERLRLVAPQGRGEHALAYDISAYGWMNEARGDSQPQRRDYSLISLQTGERRELLRDVRVPNSTLLVIEPQLTPGGAQWLYWQRGDYLLMDLASGRSRNLTAGLPVKFSLPENDPQKGWFPDDGGIMADSLPLLQGWSASGEHVLISNHWDIWALPLKAGKAINLTGDGLERDRIYRRADLSSGVGAATAEVDLTQPMYLTVYDRVTGEKGLARWDPDTGVTLLHQAFADLRYLKASTAPVWVVATMTVTEPFDYYAVEGFRPARRLTDAHPQAKDYAIGGVRYLRYRTQRGDLRHARLLLPVGYEAGRRYPMVVSIYKGRSTSPQAYGSPARPDYAWPARGYAMLLPDIVPRMNASGASALESVLAGVDAAIEAGVADPQRLGLYGHSYGGYQTLYIISQSDRFKVAAAWAGVSDQWSKCTDMYGGFTPEMTVCEFGQPYFSGPWWEQWPAYLENSPLHHAQGMNTPLLLAHGDQDVAVPFYHSVMLFNTLRRLGKPVALLAYAGEGHGLDGVRDDVWARQVALFDHYLRDGEAPEWWRDQ